MSSTSKFLSYVLRHHPEAAGVTLDAGGWVDVDVLIASATAAGHPLTRSGVEQVVRANDKQRFALSEDGRRIRANQGHSVPVDLGLVPLSPPDVLFHGTATRFLDAIRVDGLRPMSRNHVHLSADEHTAVTVGTRHGKVVVLRVRAGEMASAGHAFYRSANGVWLVDAVPVAFLDGLLA